MMPGETILSGASPTCTECGTEVDLQVLKSGAGYYLGTQCPCGPYSRESHYFRTREAAERALPEAQSLFIQVVTARRAAVAAARSLLS